MPSDGMPVWVTQGLALIPRESFEGGRWVAYSRTGSKYRLSSRNPIGARVSGGLGGGVIKTGFCPGYPGAPWVGADLQLPVSGYLRLELLCPYDGGRAGAGGLGCFPDAHALA